jgi:hypothetical protein
MASADVAGEISCLKQRIIGLRLANLYDLSAKVSSQAAVRTTTAHGKIMLSTRSTHIV